MVKPRENRVPIMMSHEELQAIDDWRFSNRVATRSDAVRRLCRIALVTEEIIEQAGQSAIHFFTGAEDVFGASKVENADPEDWLIEKVPAILNMAVNNLRLAKVFETMRSGASFEDALKIAEESADEFTYSLKMVQEMLK